MVQSREGSFIGDRYGGVIGGWWSCTSGGLMWKSLGPVHALIKAVSPPAGCGAWIMGEPSVNQHLWPSLNNSSYRFYEEWKLGKIKKKKKEKKTFPVLSWIFLFCLFFSSSCLSFFFFHSLCTPSFYHVRGWLFFQDHLCYLHSLAPLIVTCLAKL